MQSIQDNLAEHLSEGQKRKLTFGIATLGDPRVRKIMHGEKGAFNKWELCSSVIDGGRTLNVGKNLLGLPIPWNATILFICCVLLIFHVIMWK